jgi:hypothetical protein
VEHAISAKEKMKTYAGNSKAQDAMRMVAMLNILWSLKISPTQSLIDFLILRQHLFYVLVRLDIAI